MQPARTRAARSGYQAVQIPELCGGHSITHLPKLPVLRAPVIDLCEEQAHKLKIGHSSTRERITRD